MGIARTGNNNSTDAQRKAGIAASMSGWTHRGAWVALRAWAILLAGRGLGNCAIARTVDRTPRWVRLCGR